MQEDFYYSIFLSAHESNALRSHSTYWLVRIYMSEFASLKIFIRHFASTYYNPFGFTVRRISKSISSYCSGGNISLPSFASAALFLPTNPHFVHLCVII